MISKNKIKLLRSLKLKKYREQHQSTMLEGLRLIDESINFNADIQGIWMTDESIKSNQNFIDKIKSKNIKFDIIDSEDLKSISDTNHSQGAIAEINISKYFNQQLLDISTVCFNQPMKYVIADFGIVFMHRPEGERQLFPRRYHINLNVFKK